MDSDSLGILSASTVSEGFVLACKSRVLNSAATIEILKQVGRKGGQFSKESDDSYLVRHELLPKDWQFDPLALKWVVNVPRRNPKMVYPI